MMWESEYSAPKPYTRNSGVQKSSKLHFSVLLYNFKNYSCTGTAIISSFTILRNNLPVNNIWISERKRGHPAAGRFKSHFYPNAAHLLQLPTLAHSPSIQIRPCVFNSFPQWSISMTYNDDIGMIYTKRTSLISSNFLPYWILSKTYFC